MADVAAAAYQLTTNGVIKTPHVWQSTVYERISRQESEAGYILTTPTGAGKTEAVTIPSLGPRRGGAPRRLFMIAADLAPLDDYLFRLVPYLKTSAQADNTPRTVYVDSPLGDTSPLPCRRFLPEGGSDEMVVLNPMEADVDLVLTSMSRFREIFFGGGGLHGLPSALSIPGDVPQRRDLFFFDEAHTYDPEEFGEFQKLVEFLYAADMDVVVGSSTMPATFRDELGFLESLDVPDEKESSLTFEYNPNVKSADETIKLAISLSTPENRTVVVCETGEIAIEAYTELTQTGNSKAILYMRRQPSNERRAVYATIKQLESEGRGYLLLTTGTALESGDLSAEILITQMCLPEHLILRAGRCRRHETGSAGRIIVTGDSIAPGARSLGPAALVNYVDALNAQSGNPFTEKEFQSFI